MKKGYIKTGKHSGKVGRIIPAQVDKEYQIFFEDGARTVTNENDIVWLYSPKHLYRRWKWIITLFLAIVAFGLGVNGFIIEFKQNNVHVGFFNTVYVALQLFTLQMGYSTPHINWQLEVARFLAPLIFFYTLWQAIASVLQYQFQIARLYFIRDHVIICGLGHKGMLLVKNFIDKGMQVVVIDADQNNANIKECREWGAIVLFGNASDCEMLRKARVDKARHLISVCNNDGINSQIAVNTHNICINRKGRPLACFVHISDPDLCDLLKEQEILFGNADSFQHEYFNVFRQAAKALLLNYPLPPIDQEPHLVIIGLSGLGESVILQAVKSSYLANRQGADNLKITVLDKRAANKVRLLKLRYPWLLNISQIVTYDIDPLSEEFIAMDWLKTETVISNIYVTMENDQHSVATALTIAQQSRSSRLPVVVCMNNEGGLGLLLNSIDDPGNVLERIYPFGIYNHICTKEIILQGTNEFLAQAIHEEYVAEEIRNGNTVKDNPEMIAWQYLSEGMKQSNRRQAAFIGEKLKKVKCSIRPVKSFDQALFVFTMEEVEKLAEIEHESWMEERVKAGWTYAPGPKNKALKTNPCIVAWDKLPENERNKDRDTARNIPNLMAKIGYEIYRVDSE